MSFAVPSKLHSRRVSRDASHGSPSRARYIVLFVLWLIFRVIRKRIPSSRLRHRKIEGQLQYSKFGISILLSNSRGQIAYNESIVQKVTLRLDGTKGYPLTSKKHSHSKFCISNWTKIEGDFPKIRRGLCITLMSLTMQGRTEHIR